ncbi:MAG TPA: YceI family protein, partial [Longimicrobiales bacterium]
MKVPKNGGWVARSSHISVLYNVAQEELMAQKSIWEIDPAHTTVEFAVKHMMFTTVRGRLKELSGRIVADE